MSKIIEQLWMPNEGGISEMVYKWNLMFVSQILTIPMPNKDAVVMKAAVLTSKGYSRNMSMKYVT